MTYCTKCGICLPEDIQASFCPNCGIPVSISSGKIERRVAQHIRSFDSPTLKRRVLVMIASMTLCVLVTLAGVFATVDSSTALEVMQELDILQEVFMVAGIQIIFGNNLMYCLIMFVPFLGSIFGFYVLYSTGWILAAMGIVVGIDPVFLFLALLIYPHFLLEYVSYGLAMSEGFWLLYMARKGGFEGLKKESINATKVVTICTIFLLLGSLTEILFISLLSI